jgi:hypothetical protein
MKRLLLLIYTSILFFKGNASDSTILKTLKNISGVYKCAGETLSVNGRTNTFFLKRPLSKLEDVVTPICYDTLAKGNFKVLTNNTIVLSNDRNFFKLYFDFKHEKNLSQDTLYIHVLLPEDDAFFSNRFRYLINFGFLMRQLKSDSTFIKIPKAMIPYCQSPSLSFLIQDLYPQCIEEGKCYQRIYFRVFNSLDFKNGENYFTITLKNFNECFVEKMDVENDIIYFDGKDDILWRGKNYKRAKS